MSHLWNSQEPLGIVIQLQLRYHTIFEQGERWQTGLILYILAAATTVRSSQKTWFSINLQEFAQGQLYNLETAGSSRQKNRNKLGISGNS